MSYVSICCDATCDSFLAAFASSPFSHPKCRSRKWTKIGRKWTEIGRKRTEIGSKSTENSGTFAWRNAHLLSLVNRTHLLGFSAHEYDKLRIALGPEMNAHARICCGHSQNKFPWLVQVPVKPLFLLFLFSLFEKRLFVP